MKNDFIKLTSSNENYNIYLNKDDIFGLIQLSKSTLIIFKECLNKNPISVNEIANKIMNSLLKV